PLFDQVDKLGRVEQAIVDLESVETRLGIEEVTCRNVDRERHVTAEFQAGALDRQGKQLERLHIAAENRTEAALVRLQRGQAARAAASETASVAFAPSLVFASVPSSSIRLRSIAAWSRTSQPTSAGAITSLTFATARRTPSPR